MRLVRICRPTYRRLRPRGLSPIDLPRASEKCAKVLAVLHMLCTTFPQPAIPPRLPTNTFFSQHCSRSEEHTSELQSRLHLVCRLLLEKKNKQSLYYRQEGLLIHVEEHLIELYGIMRPDLDVQPTAAYARQELG